MEYEPIAKVWPWLVPLWNFGADITDLFDWKALAAIGTFWAVTIALRRDRAAEVAQLDRDAAVLISMEDYANAIRNTVRRFDTLDDSFGPLTRSEMRSMRIGAEAIIARAAIAHAIEGVGAYKPTDLPNARSLTQWMVTSSALKHLEVLIGDRARGEIRGTAHELGALDAAIEVWAAEIEILNKRRHPLMHRVDAMFKKA